MKRYGIVVISLLWLVAGCSDASDPKLPSVFPLRTDEPSVLVMGADQRAAIIVPKSDGDGNLLAVVFCAEPPPDAASSVASKFLANVKGGKPSANAEVGVESKTSRSIVELAGRGQKVLLAREFLYRACEQSLRSDFEPQDIKDLYGMGISIARIVAESGAKPEESAPPASPGP